MKRRTRLVRRLSLFLLPTLVLILSFIPNLLTPYVQPFAKAHWGALAAGYALLLILLGVIEAGRSDPEDPPGPPDGVRRPPEKYLVHDYALLGVKEFVGRSSELELLTEWVSPSKGREEFNVLVIHAIGGQGKSVLARQWLADLNLKAVRLEGAMWWGFEYGEAVQASSVQPSGESEFTKFLKHALAYTEGRSIAATAGLSDEMLQLQLQDALRKQPFLLVLDGFERLMRLYTGSWAANPSNNDIAGAMAPGNRKKREAAEWRVRDFLKHSGEIGKSRILITSRLPPADLEVLEGGYLKGCAEPLALKGFTDRDALEFWRSKGAGGTPATIQAYLASFGNHPLLIQVLAGVVKRSGGNFDVWKQQNSEFEASIHLDRETHILDFAMNGLSEHEAWTLHAIAMCPTPIEFDMTVALLVRKAAGKNGATQFFVSQYEMMRVFTALADRGLLGWKEQKRELELHPIVRDNVRRRFKEREAPILERISEILTRRLEGHSR
jgi:hypothetical protein